MGKGDTLQSSSRGTAPKSPGIWSRVLSRKVPHNAPEAATAAYHEHTHQDAPEITVSDSHHGVSSDPSPVTPEAHSRIRSTSKDSADDDIEAHRASQLAPPRKLVEPEYVRELQGTMTSTRSTESAVAKALDWSNTPPERHLSISSTNSSDHDPTRSLSASKMDAIAEDITAEAPLHAGNIHHAKSISIKTCLEGLNRIFTALRAKLHHNPEKYAPQLMLLDYFHLCKNALAFLDVGFNNEAMILANAAKELTSNHWYVYYVRSEILKARGDDDKATDELQRMTKYLKMDKNIESSVIASAIKIDSLLEQGKVKEANKAFDKIISTLKDHDSTSQRPPSESLADAAPPSLAQIFEQARETNIETVEKTNFLQRTQRVVRKKQTEGSASDSTDLKGVSKEFIRSLVEKELGFVREEMSGISSRVDTVKSGLDAQGKELDTVSMNISVMEGELHNVSSDLSHMGEEIHAVQEDVAALKKQVKALQAYQLQLDQILEQHFTKIDQMFAEVENGKIHDDRLLTISNNIMLKEYYNSIILTLTTLYTSAQVIRDGRLALDTGGIIEMLCVNALGFIPFVGSAVAQIADKGMATIEEAAIRKNAGLFVSIANSPEELYEIATQVAIDLTLHPTKQQELSRPAATKITKGWFRDKVDTCKQALTKVKKAVNKYVDGGNIYKTSFAEQAYKDMSSTAEEWIKFAKKTGEHTTVFDQDVAIARLKHAVIPESQWILVTDTETTTRYRSDTLKADMTDHTHVEIHYLGHPSYNLDYVEGSYV